MDRVFSFLLWPKREARGPWKQGRKKRGSVTCPTDRANEANKLFIIWICWLFRFLKGDRELEVRTATYGPGIDQSQHAKSVSHIINTSYWPSARSVRQVMDRVFVFLLWTKREARGPLNQGRNQRAVWTTSSDFTYATPYSFNSLVAKHICPSLKWEEWIELITILEEIHLSN